ncbi:MAG: ATP-binding protein, partial [Anaerolineae bacterium]|nr:ATP-binding protein [Anaerolineae bacterium]
LPEVDEISNIVVELKHPKITLGEKELRQVKKYMSVVLDQPEFNGANMSWRFDLVGNDYNSYVSGELESAEAHGETYLAYKRANYKIYVMKWSEVLTDFELRHKFILDKLRLERDKLATAHRSADEILAHSFESTASIAIK